MYPPHVARSVFNANDKSGTYVAVFGALKPVGTWNMHSAYYLDGSPAVGFTPNPQVDSEQHQVQFYSSGSLSDGPHTLTIVNMGQQFWFDFIALETSDSTTATVTAPTLPPGIMTLPTSTSSTLPTTSSTNPVQTTPPVRPQPTSTSTSPITSVISTLANQFVPAHATPPSTSSLLGTSTVSPNSTGTVSNHTGNSTSTSTSTQSNSTPAPPNPPSDLSSPAVTSSLPSLSTFTQSSVAPTASPVTASRHALPVGEIIGIAVGGTALILALGFLSFALWRRRRRIAARATISPFGRTPISADSTRTLTACSPRARGRRKPGRHAAATAPSQLLDVGERQHRRPRAAQPPPTGSRAADAGHHARQPPRRRVGGLPVVDAERVRVPRVGVERRWRRREGFTGVRGAVRAVAVRGCGPRGGETWNAVLRCVGWRFDAGERLG